MAALPTGSELGEQRCGQALSWRLGQLGVERGEQPREQPQLELPHAARPLRINVGPARCRRRAAEAHTQRRHERRRRAGRAAEQVAVVEEQQQAGRC